MSETKHGPVMTPEERVKLLLFGKADYGAITKSTVSGENHFRVTYPKLVAAIREAVMAEREACAKIADDSASRWDSQPDDDCASIACGDIAAAIRARTP